MENSFEGTGNICFVCNKTITEEDCEKNNRPMKMPPIPGYVHRKCKINSEDYIINSSFNFEDLTGKY